MVLSCTATQAANVARALGHCSGGGIFPFPFLIAASVLIFCFIMQTGKRKGGVTADD